MEVVDNKTILDAYADGSELTLMITSFNVSYNYIIKVLNDYKEANREKKSFTDDFKKMVAQRDINGISRNAISKELGINPNTVKKFCEKFGQAVKGKNNEENEYTRIEGKFSTDECPTCKAKKPNTIEKTDTYVITYCMKCGDEHTHPIKKDGDFEDYVLKLNFEYIEE